MMMVSRRAALHFGVGDADAILSPWDSGFADRAVGDAWNLQ